MPKTIKFRGNTYPSRPTYDELLDIDGDYWCDKLIYGWNDGDIEYLPQKYKHLLTNADDRIKLLFKTFPTMTRKNINEIIGGINYSLENIRKVGGI